MTERMSRAELRAGAGLAAVYGLRMLGLFFILPVFAVHAVTLRGGHDLTLVGIAIGGYGLTQGLLQVPFGMASDRWGRKQIIYARGDGAGDLWATYNGSFVNSDDDLAADDHALILNTRAADDVDLVTDGETDTATNGSELNDRSGAIGSGGGAQFTNVKIGEIVVVDRAATADEIAALAAYFREFWETP